MKTTAVIVEDGRLHWPSGVPDGAFMIAYLHSELKVGPVEPLDAGVLYEAWSFDGRTSWHLWQRDGAWVCTALNAESIDPSCVMRSRQYLSEPIQRRLKQQNLAKDCLEILEIIDFDPDGQAYVVYSCPIDFV